jgi:plastocyanin
VVRGRLLIAGAAAAVLLVPPSPASAVSRKIGIGDFRWTPPEVTIDLGESVTWFWTGPDTQHSITGLSANAIGMDSDPGNGAPDHAPGDRFTLRFSQPGVYEFHCKLHAIVRGRVVVTATPGSSAPSPDPDPPLAVDVRAPELTEVRFGSPRMRYGRGAELRYTLDERSRITFDVMREPRRGKKRWRYVGTRRFDGHIGWNTWSFDGRIRGHRLKPGRYRALLVAADGGNNRTADVRVPFRVVRTRR